MKKYIFTTILFTGITSLSFSQNIQLTHDTGKTKFIKFYIAEFEDKPPVTTKYLFLDPKTISDLSTISDTANAEISKLLKVDFVLKVKFLKGTKLLNLNEVLKLHGIPAIYWTLPVVVDDRKIDYPQTILIAKNQIKKVEVLRNTEGSYISITLI